MKISFIFLLLLSTFTSFSQFDKVKVGDKAPQFVIVNKKDKVDISQLKGKVILINFFATWCSPCRMELPILQKKIWEKYKGDKNFNLVIIGRGHTEEEVNLFKTKTSFVMPMYPDPDKTIYNLFATQYIPRNYLIDKNGNIRFMSKGFDQSEFDAMSDLIKVLLNE